MMLRRIFPILLLLLCSCAASQGSAKTVLLDYEDFGPPSMANELLGMDWWQWQAAGDVSPQKQAIKVVVYRNIDLEEAKRLHPVVPEQLRDFRYAEHAEALAYLNRHIAEDAIKPLTERLKKTRETIWQQLGSD